MVNSPAGTIIAPIFGVEGNGTSRLFKPVQGATGVESCRGDPMKQRQERFFFYSLKILNN